MATRSSRLLRAGRLADVGWARRLVIMVKAPQAGRVKTRLAREIGVVGATSFYRHASAAVVGRLGCDRRWQTLLAVAPDTAMNARYWPARLARRAQGHGDLGRRMQGLFDRMPPGPVIIIGSDCPTVRADDIAAAFVALGRADAVLGPAPDGGYWLVGERRSPKALPAFSGVRWSSEHTLADTMANFAARRVALVRQLPDVDTAADLAGMNGKAARRVLAWP
ncbi:MAG TPA: TIGR04282 family arsenosugar biosynthesis glycosyltransferase [Hyphomicrobiaceae bacterium]|nr:TIGR04282 family arsenosugar biosynthesis glycosyltransferase [Hyphomicrobiaceae bacterium]